MRNLLIFLVIATIALGAYALYLRSQLELAEKKELRLKDEFESREKAFGEELKQVQIKADEKISSAEAQALNKIRLNEALLKAAEDRALAKSIQLQRFEYFGNADPRNISASFAKAVCDREIEVDFHIALTAHFKFPKKLAAGSAFPEGRAEEESAQSSTSSPLRKGFLLGTRSHSVFGIFMITLSERELFFPVKQVDDISVKTADQYSPLNHTYSYELKGVEVSAFARISRQFGAAADIPCTIIHAWKTPDYAIFVVGYDTPNAPSVELLPYKNDRNWLNTVETTKPFPICTLNGCVALTIPGFERDYDHRGALRPWNGLPSSIGALFLPVEMSTKPVLHSFIYQIDPKQAFWVPVWGEKKYLDAVSDVFNLNEHFSIKYEYKGATHPLELNDVGANNKLERQKLLESYRSLLKNAEAL